MKTTINKWAKLALPAAMITVALAGCSTLKSPEGADDLRSKLTELQSDPELASRAPAAIKDAETAVIAAEQPRKDSDLARHLVYIADHKIDIAAAQAQTRLLEDQRMLLKEETSNARLDSRTREAELARIDAESARNDADVMRNEAYEARLEAGAAQQQTNVALKQAEDLQKQISELNAKATDRGLLVTLGDVLFDSGKAELKNGVSGHLGKLAAFLNQYQDRNITIEGHTDNIGSDSTNLALSQRRADAVKSYLVHEGIASSRINATGQGESHPVSANDSATGRQMNRRVEVIIANSSSAAPAALPAVGM